MNKKQKVYLIAKYFARPKNKRSSHIKNNMNVDGGVQWDEQVKIATRIKPADLTTAKIILDITSQTVNVNTFNTGKTFIELFEYFYNGSPKEISAQLRDVGIVIEPTTNIVSTAE